MHNILDRFELCQFKACKVALCPTGMQMVLCNLDCITVLCRNTGIDSPLSFFLIEQEEAVCNNEHSTSCLPHQVVLRQNKDYIFPI